MLLTAPLAPFAPLATEVAPLCWRRSFPGAAEQARAVRAFVACLLHDCPLLDDVLLAAAELAANAVRHTKSGQSGGSFTVEVSRAGGRVAVSVTDQGGPDEPVVRTADPLAESGRGLHTVSRTADTWGWHGNDSSRTVTAVFPLPTPNGAGTQSITSTADTPNSTTPAITGSADTPSTRAPEMPEVPA